MGAVVYVCRGSKCKKRKVPKKLAKRLQVQEVKCQKVCRGLVVGIRVDGTLEWFKRVNSKKDVKALRKIARGGGVARRLADKRSKKRSGKLR